MIDKLTDEKINQILAKEKPGYVVDTNATVVGMPDNIDVQRGAPDLQYLRQKFLSKTSTIVSSKSGVRVITNGQVVAEQG